MFEIEGQRCQQIAAGKAVLHLGIELSQIDHFSAIGRNLGQRAVELFSLGQAEEPLAQGLAQNRVLGHCR